MLKEIDIQREILEWGRKRNFLIWRNSNMPTRARRNLTFMPKGMPDIFFLYDKQLIGVEVKMPGGRLSQEQIGWGDVLMQHGGHYFVVTSLQELIDCLVHNFGEIKNVSTLPYPS